MNALSPLPPTPITNTKQAKHTKNMSNDEYLEYLEKANSRDINTGELLIFQKLDELKTEYIRLKAIEQAAIDFVKSDKVIENIEDLSYSNLKELLPID